MNANATLVETTAHVSMWSFADGPGWLGMCPVFLLSTVLPMIEMEGMSRNHSVSWPRSCSAYDESCYPCLKINTCGKQWYLTLRQVKTRCGILPCKLWLMNCNVVLVFRSVALLPRRRFISGPLMAFRCLNAAFIPPWSPQPVTKTAA